MNQHYATHSTHSTNSNSTMPQQHDATHILQQVAELVEARLASSLLYQVQCVNCEEAGVLLSIDEGTVRDWIKAGKLAASKVGREWVIRVRDIDAMLSRYRDSPIVPINDKRFRVNRRKSA